MKTEQEIHELISALLDGESTTPREDAALLHSETHLQEQQRQYQEIGRLMRTLPAPDPSEHFVDAVLARLPQKKRNNIIRISFSLASAALLFLAFAVGLYTLLPDHTPEQASDTHPLVADDTASSAHLDVPEDILLSLQIEAIENNDLEKMLALFETMSEETLITALAEMTLEEEARYYATTEDTLAVPLSWNTWPITTSSSFSDAFLLLETLDDAEAAALNTLLRDALAET